MRVRSDIRRGSHPYANHVVAVVALAALLAGCGQQSGADTPSGPGGSNGSGGPTGGGGPAAGGPPNPCTFLPDDALKTALGAAPTGDRTVRRGSGLQECTIQTAATPAAVLQVSIGGNGREGFEIHRQNVKSVESLYQPLTGIGEDAFAFGNEVTVLKGEYSVTLFLEGPAFDDVSKADRLERTKTLAKAAVAQMSG